MTSITTIKTATFSFKYTRLAFQIQLLLLLITWTTWGAWIDVDTPEDKMTTSSLIDGTEYHLIMSDEFNVPNRTFEDGEDTMWTALDKSDDDMSSAGGGSLHFYNSTTITTTADGMLEILSELGKTEWEHYDHVNKEYKQVTKYFKSGMLQSWNKFCFTGGIVEVDVIFPGDPFVGGLWPAIWILGNLGRATYEASTNNIWPWSFDTCDRKLQQSQALSACNEQNHFGMNSRQGRGATEIDIVEVMTGLSDGALPATDPPIGLPYADMTLQLAPGIPNNRPQSGAQPIRQSILSKNGHTEFPAQTWYEGLEFQGNTSLNPFFYGTYLGETKPEEPVTRNKNQAFQADAVGAMHQLTPSHFQKVHTFRVEWQPGPGGRIDWFSKGHKTEDGVIEGDGFGTDWVKALTIKDGSLRNLTGAQIPNEPSYLIMNTAISSTWGFPYDVPNWCPRCYDCDNVTCACAFYPGFCSMMKKTRVAMYIDSVRVYQSKDDSAHVGKPHTVGCDLPEFPSKEYIEGHMYRYSRALPFSYYDTSYLMKVKNGGGKCVTNSDCGGVDEDENEEKEKFDDSIIGGDQTSTSPRKMNKKSVITRGYCVAANSSGGLFGRIAPTSRCKCHFGFSGSHCKAMNHSDDEPGAYALKKQATIFHNMPKPQLPPILVGSILTLIIGLIIVLAVQVSNKNKEMNMLKSGSKTSDDDVPILGQVRIPKYRARRK